MQTIETQRLILRPFAETDLGAFYLLGTVPEVIRYAQPKPYASMAEALEMMRKAPLHDYATYGYGRFACVWKESNQVIGFSGVKYLPQHGETELGYRFLPLYWGMGLATEAGAASIDFAREQLGLKRLVGHVHADNPASAHVLQKLGFTLESTQQFDYLPEALTQVFARSL